MINNRVTDLINRIRTAISSNKDGYIIKHTATYNSKEILDLLSILADGGYIHFSPLSNSWYLNSSPNTLSPLLSSISPISVPGKRKYRGYKDINEEEIVRTSRGIKWGNVAKREREGGEILLKVGRGTPHSCVSNSVVE